MCLNTYAHVRLKLRGPVPITVPHCVGDSTRATRDAAHFVTPRRRTGGGWMGNRSTRENSFRWLVCGYMYENIYIQRRGRVVGDPPRPRPAWECPALSAVARVACALCVNLLLLHTSRDTASRGRCYASRLGA